MLKELILGILALACIGITLKCWESNTKITRKEGLKYPERINLRGKR